MVDPIDVLTIAQPEERDNPGGYAWFAVEPDALYREMGAYAVAVIQTDSFVEADYQGYKMALANIGTERVQALVCYRDDVSVADRPVRYFVLETLRQWFTRLLNNSQGKPLGLRILKDDRWRL